MKLIDSLISERLGGEQFGKSTELYKFAKIKQAREEVLKAHPHKELIDMGVGEPDQPADSSLCQILSEESGKRENRFYSDNGMGGFQEAAVHFMEEFYGVTGITSENVIHGVGSKPILAMLPLGFINPGDITLMTVPGYPILGTHTHYLGGEIYPLPLKKEKDFFQTFMLSLLPSAAGPSYSTSTTPTTLRERQPPEISTAGP